MLWFNNLTINVDPAHPAGMIGNLTELCTAFQLHFLFDPAQKWRHLSEFFKTRQTEGEKSEDYIRRCQEEGIKARASEEQILNTIMGGFLPFIQSSVSNHDIEGGAAGLAAVKKWSLVAETFLPVVQAGTNTARLHRQIEDLSAKLERTQMRVVNEPTRRGVHFNEGDEAHTPTASRTASPEGGGRAMGSGSRSSSPTLSNRGDQGQRSRSSELPPPMSRGRQPDWQQNEMRRDGSRARYNGDNHESFVGLSYGQERQRGDTYEGSQRTFSRGGPPRRGMQPYFFRGGRGAPGGRNRFGGQRTNLGQNSWQNSGQNMGRNMGQGGGCYNCDNRGRCERGACPALNVTCFTCSKVGHFSNKCWRNQNQ